LITGPSRRRVQGIRRAASVYGSSILPPPGYTFKNTVEAYFGSGEAEE
jgi:hypothetical protein